jgi:tetratricopeptide (TPR) repeat protein
MAGLATVQITIADVLLGHGDVEAAIQLATKSEALWRQLYAADSAAVQNIEGLARSCAQLGTCLARAGRDEESQAKLQESFALRERLRKAGALSSEQLRQLTIAREQLGRELEAAGKLREALALHLQNLPLRESAAQKQPGRRARRDLSVCLESIGLVQLRLGELDKSVAALRRCLEIKAALSQQAPADVHAALDVANAWLHVANGLAKQGDAKACLEAHARARSRFVQLVDKHPGNVKLRHGQANHEEVAAVNLGRLGRREEARRCWIAALKLHKRNADRDDATLAEVRHCAATLRQLPVEDLRDLEAAVVYGKKAVAMTKGKDVSSLWELMWAYEANSQVSAALATAKQALAVAKEQKLDNASAASQGYVERLQKKLKGR